MKQCIAMSFKQTINVINFSGVAYIEPDVAKLDFGLIVCIELIVYLCDY